MDSEFKPIAEELRDWFESVVRMTSVSLFGIAADGPHRDAVVLDVLKRNARLVSHSKLDCEGKLYSPLCFFLAAACRTLGTPLGVGHWRAAVENVIHLEQNRSSSREESAKVGLEIPGPAMLFKQEFDEAVIQSGLTGRVSYLDRDDRRVALGLAVNWGMRLMLAYALECGISTNDPSRKDLAWLGHLIEPLVHSLT